MLLWLCGSEVFAIDAEDYNGIIKERIEQRIEEQKKECPGSWSKDKCSAMSRLYVESSVWADVLDSDWKIESATVRGNHVILIIVRGKDVPLIGELDIGEIKNIEKVYVDTDGRLVLEYNSRDSPLKENAGWFGGGALVGFLIALAIAIL